MAKNTKFTRAEFDGLLDSIRIEARDQESLPPNLRDSLEKVKRTLENFHKSQEQGGQRVRSKKAKFNPSVPHAASRALWMVCDEYLQDAMLGHDRFEQTFVTLGADGYKNFRSEVQTAVLIAVQGVMDEEAMDAGKQEEVRHHFTKMGGWVDMALMELPKFAMDNVINALDKGVGVAESSDPRVQNPGFLSKRRGFLENWSQFMKDCRSGSSIRVVGEKNDGLAIIRQFTAKKKEIRPSRIAGGQKQLLFIETDQIVRGRKIGEGSYGEVHLCTLQNIPYIPSGTQCCVKTWIPPKDNDDGELSRKSAISEAILGGLDHMGIVSAFAMTTSDPPELIYDYYNGGTLRDMIDRVKKSRWPSAEDFLDSAAKRKRAEIDIFMRDRLQICFAILEALEFYHTHGRLHNDLHSDNVLLHFKYDVEGSDHALPERIYVGICDFGRSTYISQAQSDPSARMWALKRKDVRVFLKDYPHYAPEIVSIEPDPYTEQTDIWALGRLFEIILLNKTKMARENLQSRSLCHGWVASVMQKRLHTLITTMKEKKPELRKDCGFYGRWMYEYFREAGIKRNNVEFFRE